MALVRRRDAVLGGPGVVAPVGDQGVLRVPGDELGDGGAVFVLFLDEVEGEVKACCYLLMCYVRVGGP